MAGRTYFVDALTGEELSHPLNGRADTGCGANGASPVTAVQYEDTAWQVYLQVGRKTVTVTAADFPGRLVVAKMWGPGNGKGARAIERRLLIADGDGFVTLDKVDGRGAMSRDSYGRPFRDHVRGEILSNRAALEWIAARRTQRAAVAA